MLEQALTVQQFKDLLFERYPQINNKKFQIVAVNEEFVQKSDFIQPNDTVALIPPVSGRLSEHESNNSCRWSFSTIW